MLVLPADFTPASLPLCLSDGRDLCCTLRRLGAEDGSALLRFFKSHSQDTLYRRYGTRQVAMSTERAARLVGVDQGRDAALALFERDEEGEHIIGVGRYTCSTDGASAELAFVVHERRRRRGLCTLLLAALLRFAARQGIREVYAQTQEDNFAMIGILIKAGAHLSTIEGTHAVELRLVLPKNTGAGKSRRGLQR